MRRRIAFVILGLAVLVIAGILSQYSPKQAAYYSPAANDALTSAVRDRSGRVLIASSQPYAPAGAANKPRAEDSSSGAMLIRTATLSMRVKSVRTAAQQIVELVDTVHGEIEYSTVSGENALSGEMRIRVPAGHLQSTLEQLRGMGVKVDVDQQEARDISREFTDAEARLRNMHAEEAQYLQIMKQAYTVKDALEVSEKLSDVRGRIEQLQSQVNLLAHQVEMSAISISLTQLSDAKVLGLDWRPLYSAKLALRHTLSGLAEWADAMIALLLTVPLVLAWIASMLIVVAIAWKVTRWLWRYVGPSLRALKLKKLPAQA